MTTSSATPIDRAPEPERPQARALDRRGLEAALRRVLPGGAARACARWLELALFERGALHPEDLADGPRSWREAALSALRVEPLLERVGGSRCEEDGSVRSVLAVPRLGGERIETVAIPRREDLNVCISSQAGCALGCRFCATALLGHRGNLRPEEMLEQVAWGRRLAGRRPTDAVFMGMGEPFLNYDAVIAAARALTNPRGPQISPRKIIISTAGVVPAIRRFVREGHRYQLYFSINSAIPAKRRELMPIEESYPLPELVEAIGEYQASLRRNRWAMLEYVAIPGVNMGDEDIDALGAAFGKIPCIIDVIPWNTVHEEFRPPTWEEVSRFTVALRRLGMPVKVRYSSGKKHGGGCGQLAGGEAPPRELEGHLGAPPGTFSDLSR